MDGISRDDGRGDERDGQGWTVAAYQPCDPGVYEGAIDLYCRHLEMVHHCPPALLDPLRRGLSQTSWSAVDRLHRTYLEFKLA